MEVQGDAGIGGLLAPSPQSEAVTHEMGELTLHPGQRLPPLNERKNGKYSCEKIVGLSLLNELGMHNIALPF